MDAAETRLEVPFHLGPWHVHPHQLQVISPADDVLSVEAKVMAVLCCLAAQAGRIVARDRLMEIVWPHVVVSDDTLNRCISQLRKLLNDSPTRPTYIETIRGRGYRLCLIPVVAPSPTTSVHPTLAPQRGHKRLAWAVLTVLLGALAAGWYMGQRSSEVLPMAHPKGWYFVDSTGYVSPLRADSAWGWQNEGRLAAPSPEEVFSR